MNESEQFSLALWVGYVTILGRIFDACLYTELKRSTPKCKKSTVHLLLARL